MKTMMNQVETASSETFWMMKSVENFKDMILSVFLYLKTME